jgi:hypothetical protein
MLARGCPKKQIIISAKQIGGNDTNIPETSDENSTWSSDEDETDEVVAPKGQVSEVELKNPMHVYQDQIQAKFKGARGDLEKHGEAPTNTIARPFL